MIFRKKTDNTYLKTLQSVSPLYVYNNNIYIYIQYTGNKKRKLLLYIAIV